MNKAFFPSGTNNLCVSVDKSEEFIGLKCSSCNSSNVLTLTTARLGNEDTVNYNGVVVVVDELGVTTKNFISCRENVKVYTRYYLIFLALLGFVALLISGLDGFESFTKGFF